MFQSLSDGLQGAFKSIRGKGKLTEANMREGLQMVEEAMLEADVSYQVVQEALNAMTRKLGASPSDTRAMFRDVLVSLWTISPSPDLNHGGLDIDDRYGHVLDDARIVSAALRHGCQRVLSEDLHNGHVIDSMEIVNPFTTN